ncbi:MAG: TonB-dependent receptor, partial [Candidatus Marinimicrobia bacterium]|nr:TonB-dependent receptor [Candidatus Neomarinimicrobiota bacterium]
MKDGHMRLKQYYLLVTLCIISLLSAQHQHGGKGGGRPSGCEIYGMVIDSISGQPIEYTSISIIDSDKSIATGGVTDSDGKFEIEEIKPGEYDVKIEFMGFSPVIFSDIKLSFRDQRVKDLGTIKLVPSSLELEAVKVLDERPIFEFETDKMVYNSSEDIISDSGTAEDVLNKVPMVTVDQDGAVELRGNPNVKILVNGRPNRTGEGGKSVDNIPASLIDKVEVITSPSAKYDPDGMAGIINIVLKKGKYEGFNGSLKINGKSNENAGMGDMNGFTAYGNYRGEKWNLYSSVNLNNRLRIIEGDRQVYTTYLDGSIPDSIDFNFLNNSDRIGSSFKFGADYSINEHLIVNGEINYDQHLHDGVNTQYIFQPEPVDTLEINDGDF